MTEPTDTPPTSISPLAPSDLAPSAQFLADLEGRWVGEGINTLWVPAHAGPQAPVPPTMYNPQPGVDRPLPRFISSRTTETIVVEAPLGSVPNKGAAEDFEESAAPYEHRAFDENGHLIHAENGYWLVTPETTQPAAAAQVAKLSSIPHGSVAILQSDLSSRSDGAAPVPTPAAVSVMPVTTTPMAGLSQPTAPLDSAYLGNVALYIQRRFEADRTGLLWQLELAHKGVVNIAFLDANARVTSINSTLIVGNLGIRTDAVGSQEASVLAYMQTTLVNFDGIDWPHISVGYLIKDMESR